MYMKNRLNSTKFKAFGSCQTLCLTESFVLRNRLLFIYKPKKNIKIPNDIRRIIEEKHIAKHLIQNYYSTGKSS